MNSDLLLNNVFNKLDNILDEIYPEKINFKELDKFCFFLWKKKFFSCYLKAMPNSNNIGYNDLIGIESAKAEIYFNTLQFVKGYSANNVLLWGEKGCGKSSLIKSLVLEFKDYSLKLIEVKNDNLASLEDLFDILTTLEDYKFIIFLDDISFNEEDNKIKYMKSVIEGGIEYGRKNLLIYATSNRRHMIKEKSISIEEIHESEAISEKISLSDRFGISIGLYKPNKELYLQIVKHYARKYKLDSYVNPQEALNWAMKKGGFSGRTAYQYVIYLYKNLV